jgi:hypothetical protein
MANFYGTVAGRSATIATRCGTKSIKTTAQSWDGSVIIELFEDSEGRTLVEVCIDTETSASYGDNVFCGTIEQLADCLDCLER